MSEREENIRRANVRTAVILAGVALVFFAAVIVNHWFSPAVIVSHWFSRW